MEEWREIADFPGFEVSDHGRIKNAVTGNVLKPGYVGGKLAVSIRRSRTPELVYIHREVAKAFINSEIHGVVVKHVNGMSADCRVANLRVTPFRAPLARSQGRKVMVLETEEVYDSVAECAKAISGTPTCIYAVLAGKAWTHRGLHFKYVE